MGAIKEIKEKLGSLVDIHRPHPDSQFRLVPCSCGSRKVAYICYGHKDHYTVMCDTCGKQTALHYTKHKAQIEWNGRSAPSWDRD